MNILAFKIALSSLAVVELINLVWSRHERNKLRKEIMELKNKMQDDGK